MDMSLANALDFQACYFRRTFWGCDSGKNIIAQPQVGSVLQHARYRLSGIVKILGQ